MSERLTRVSLESALSHAQTSGIQVLGPEFNPDDIAVGIVHLGIGAFHRAHQAVYTELAAAKNGDTRWGIMGVTQRSRSVVDQLQPQDCLYSVLEKGAESTELRVISSVRDVAFPGSDSSRVIAVLARPTTHIVSLTVTEKGYRATAAGGLDTEDPSLRADIDLIIDDLGVGSSGGPDERNYATPIGLLVRGLLERARRALAPTREVKPGGITVLCCDNMVDNGRVVQRLVSELLEAAGIVHSDPVWEWLMANVTYPCTMVDRIVPATTAANRKEALEILAVHDEGLVVAEPFMQWVIEDNFAGPRPKWEEVGATLTDDVAPFEQAKLRMLNGSHSMLAYLGALHDKTLIADAVLDPEIGATVRAFLHNDVVPTLTIPQGMDLEEYAASLLDRFSNPNTGHTTIQVAMDGSKKLPFRIFGTVSDRLSHGVIPTGAAQALASWLIFVARGASFAGSPLVLDDPRSAELSVATGRGNPAVNAWGLALEAEVIVDNVWALPNLVPQDVANHEEFRAAVAAEMRAMLGR